MDNNLTTQSKRPTINDVARLAGVSKKTVSRVLNNSPQVTDKTRQKVTAVMEQLNYEPDPQARGLASKYSYLLGLVYDNPNTIYISDVQKGILAACRGAGYELIMHPGDFNSRELTDDVCQFVSRARIGGLILLSPISQVETLARRLRKSQVPYVRISPKLIDTTARVVVSDDKFGAELMAEYLVSIGHRDIGFITGPPSSLSTQQKFEGFHNIMQKYKLPVQECLVVEGDNTFASGALAGQQLLECKKRPTVIFASNDAMALGVMKSATMLDISVPEQLSVAGYDDSALATVTWPDLTTIRQPVELMGEFAARKLIKQLSGGAVTSEASKVVKPELVVRNSTRELS